MDFVGPAGGWAAELRSCDVAAFAEAEFAFAGEFVDVVVLVVDAVAPAVEPAEGRNEIKASIHIHECIFVVWVSG